MTVIAIGIPTVIHAATIVRDTMEQMIKVLSELTNMEGNAGFETLRAFDDNEKMNLIMELMDEKLVNMFVTPKDIDESIQFMAETVAYGINLLFSLTHR